MRGNFFCKNNNLNCKGKLLSLNKPIVAGILNITPDSFYDGGFYTSKKDIIQRVEKMLTEGAGIIDIGGYSSRPNATNISEQEEIVRLIPTIQLIAKRFPDVILSADTFRSNVAKQAIEEGAYIINDISGGTMDEDMYKTIAHYKVPYVLMHIQKTPQTMQIQPFYNNLFHEMFLYFSDKLKTLKQLGINDIIIDPGFGFGKTLEHNYEILKNIKNFRLLECPILVGISRKSMISKVIDATPTLALNGTTVAHVISLLQETSILRTHDVKEAIEAIKIIEKVKNTPLG